MSNTSATGGPLTPKATPAPLDGVALQNFLHDWIEGVTGYPAPMVRPSWQPEPANLPNNSTNWLAFRISLWDSDTFAADLHFPSGSGYNEIRRHQVLTVALSFYGPDADMYAGIFRDGVQVAQNREMLTLNNMGLVETTAANPAPELVKDKWYYRVDMTVKIRRQVVRQYAVESLQSGNATLDNEVYTTDINI